MNTTIRAKPGNRNTHGMYGTPTYRSWASMHARCRGTSSKPEYYLGKGIIVCERWSRFANFLADMGERPEGATLDRFPDRNGNYESENCRWATKTQQSVNRGNTRLIQLGSECHCTLEWSRRLDIPEGTIRARLNRGWLVGEALTKADFHFRSGTRGSKL